MALCCKEAEALRSLLEHTQQSGWLLLLTRMTIHSTHFYLFVCFFIFSWHHRFKCPYQNIIQKETSAARPQHDRFHGRGLLDLELKLSTQIQLFWRTQRFAWFQCKYKITSKCWTVQLTKPHKALIEKKNATEHVSSISDAQQDLSLTFFLAAVIWRVFITCFCPFVFCVLFFCVNLISASVRLVK